MISLNVGHLSERGRLCFIATIVVTSIKRTTHTIAGRIPPISSLTIDTLVIDPYMIRGMLGGKIGPTIADAAVTAPENSFVNPRSRIASISIFPRPPISASAAPEIPEKIRLAKMLTCANPPGKRPTVVPANEKIRRLIPAEFIKLPTRMNTGTATSGNESSAYIMRWETISKGKPMTKT